MKKPIIIVVVGPPEGGKTSHSKAIGKQFGLPVLSTGKLTEAVTGELKVEVESYRQSGGLVPDPIVCKIVRDEVFTAKKLKLKKKYKNGIVFEGFPRNLPQAEYCDQLFDVDWVIHLCISNDDSLARAAEREACIPCNETYNPRTKPSKIPGQCDLCNGPLGRRPDDRPEIAKDRLDTYYKTTYFILDHYPEERIIEVSSARNFTEVHAEIMQRFESKGLVPEVFDSKPELK